MAHSSTSLPGWLQSVDPKHPVRLGISSCLLGEAVRYDGQDKRNSFIADVVGPLVEWVPVCPEAGAGLGVPRPPIRLEGRPGGPAGVVEFSTGRDLTEVMETFSSETMTTLRLSGVDGFILKARSPSCGLTDVPVHDARGTVVGTSDGVFARTVKRLAPGIPVIDDESLADPAKCRQFFAAVRKVHVGNVA